MSEVAQLGLEVQSKGVDETNRGLDELDKNATRAARATDNLSVSATKLNTATGQSTAALIKMAAAVGALAGGIASLAIKGFEELVSHLGDFIKDVIKSGAESERTGTILRLVGASAGWTATQISQVKEAFAANNIVGSEANTVITRLAATHLSAASAMKAAKLASDLAVVGNTNAADAADKLAFAIASGSNYALRSLKIHADLTDAVKKQAETHGKNTKSISESEAAEARLNAILQASTAYTGAHAASLATLSGKAQDATAKWILLKEALGEAALPLAKAAMDAIGSALTHILPLIEEAAKSFKEFTGPGSEIGRIFEAVTPIVKDVWEILKDVGSTLEDIATSDFANWLEGQLLYSFKELISILETVRPLFSDLKHSFDDLSNSGFGHFVGSILIDAFKDLVLAVEAAINIVKSFAVVAVGAIRDVSAATNPKYLLSTAFAGTGLFKGPTALDAINANDKQTDAALAKIRQEWAAKVALDKLPAAQGRYSRGGSTTQEQNFPFGTSTDNQIRVPGTSGRTRTPRDENQQQIDKAILDELKAREALTGSIEEATRIKKLENAAELDQQKEQLKQKVASKNITQATADRALAIYKTAAAEKDELADREAINETNKRILANQSVMTDYSARQAKAFAGMSSSSSERADVEVSILKQAQLIEMAEKKEADRKAVEAGTLTKGDKATQQAEADRQEAALRAAQQAELEEKELAARVARVHESAQMEQDYQQIQSDVLHSQQDAAQTEIEKYLIGKKILASDQAIARSKAQEEVDAAQEAVLAHDTAENERILALALAKQAALTDIQANQTKAASGNLLDNMSNVSSGFQSMGEAIKSHNWIQLFQAIDQTITAVIKLLDSFGNSVGQSGGGISGFFSKLFGGGQSQSSGGILGSIGKLLGIGGGGLGGFGGIGGALGSAISGGAGGLGAIGGFGGIGGALGSAIGGGGAVAGGLGGIASLVGSLAGPIGIIAGIGSLLGGLFKSKPSNFTAVSQFHGLDSVSFTGDKPNENTMGLIKQASQGILDAEKSLSQFGITVKTTIAAIEIGQRDASKIHLSTGKILTSAVGDAAAAADTALKAVLAEAEYTDPQMKKLVDSMLAAGKGFDDITQTLSDYKTVQENLKAVDNSILAITDPLKAGINNVTESIQKQRDAYKQNLDAMLLTQEQFDHLNQQLSILQDLQIGQVFAQMKEQILGGATTALQDAYNAVVQKVTDAQSAFDTAQTNLISAYNNEVNIRQNVISTFKQLSASLKDFMKTLDTATPGLSPENAYNAIKAQYQDVTNKTLNGTREERAAASEQYQQIAQAFLQASESYHGVGSGFQDDLAAVKKNTQDAIARDDLTVANAQRQIDILTQAVSVNVKIETGVLTVADGIRALMTAKDQLAIAKQAQADAKATIDPILHIDSTLVDIKTALQNYLVAQNSYNQQLNDALKANHTDGGGTGGDYAKYVEQNGDLLQYWKAQQGWAAGLSETEFGLQHWSKYGQYENRAVKPYATGGEFKVGGVGGTDSQLVQMMASPSEHVTVRTPAQIAAEIAIQEKMADSVGMLSSKLDVLIAETKNSEEFLRYLPKNDNSTRPQNIQHDSQSDDPHKERLIKLIEEMSAKLDQLIIEAKADKTQRAEGVRMTVDQLTELRDSFETLKRRQSSK